MDAVSYAYSDEAHAKIEKRVPESGKANGQLRSDANGDGSWSKLPYFPNKIDTIETMPQDTGMVTGDMVVDAGGSIEVSLGSYWKVV
jgi:hypothetical protein